jgi:hypothetical protein
MITEYTVLRPVNVGKPPRQLKKGDTVRVADLAGWGVQQITLVGLVAQNTLQPITPPAEPVPPPPPPTQEHETVHQT